MLSNVMLFLYRSCLLKIKDSWFLTLLMSLSKWVLCLRHFRVKCNWPEQLQHFQKIIMNILILDIVPKLLVILHLIRWPITLCSSLSAHRKFTACHFPLNRLESRKFIGNDITVGAFAKEHLTAFDILPKPYSWRNSMHVVCLMTNYGLPNL